MRHITGTNPQTGETIEGQYPVADENTVEATMQKAWTAWKTYRSFSGKKKAAFLRAIADEIEGAEGLVGRAMLESGLPEGRITGERGRTCNQLRMFATLVEEGSWVEATIDKAQPDRQPIPKADIRKMLVPTGPVVVFTASNFPLAFSTAGGDTASALAAGNPVVVKAHESHPGTNDIVSNAILRAAEKTGMPEGIFATLYGQGYKLGKQLVLHPLTKSVAFTGSFRGGKALYDLAGQRAEPIPVFAEMGSVNPIFILPKKLEKGASDLAGQIAQSVNLGVGQFCTNPGILVAMEGEGIDQLKADMKAAFNQITPACMLNKGIYQNFENKKGTMLKEAGVEVEFQFDKDVDVPNARPAIASVNAVHFLMNEKLQEEVFGPFTLLVTCRDEVEFLKVANHFAGQLTATIMGEEGELTDHADLFAILQEKVGRLIFNGVPTGVEVCHSMQHGGPFPATTDGRFTSVGTAAIKRFARPLAFQDCPAALLPDELKDDNPLNIVRVVDGEWRTA
jgi:alpha-ketoglutaric semialdehyde dehydrogenase